MQVISVKANTIQARSKEHTTEQDVTHVLCQWTGDGAHIVTLGKVSPFKEHVWIIR